MQHLERYHRGNLAPAEVEPVLQAAAAIAIAQQKACGLDEYTGGETSADSFILHFARRLRGIVRRLRPAPAGGDGMQARGGWVSWILSVAVISALGLMVLGSSPVHADGTWLDSPVSETLSWNVPGMAVPSAAVLPTDPTMVCAEMVRPPETAVDLVVIAAGWKLVGILRSGWGITTMDGTAGFDHMCRASTWMEFVFVDGLFAGTTSPGPMHVGSDGDGGVLSIGSGNLFGSIFIRYQARDPHCCPSGNSAVRYRIDRTDAGPVLVPVQATTVWQQP